MHVSESGNEGTAMYPKKQDGTAMSLAGKPCYPLQHDLQFVLLDLTEIIEWGAQGLHKNRRTWRASAMNVESIVHQRSAKSICSQVESQLSMTGRSCPDNRWKPSFPYSVRSSQCFDLHCHSLSAAQGSCNACNPAQRTTGFWRIGVGTGLPSWGILPLIKIFGGTPWCLEMSPI